MDMSKKAAPKNGDSHKVSEDRHEARQTSFGSTPPPAPPSVSDTGADGADNGSESAPNLRKRKKASRACDYCHVNHQPCDNGQPRCSVCTKHDKPCLYLRPTKRRGPQKGYRTALNSYKESAAAWGAVLTAIPGLDALIEGHLLTNQGPAVIKSVKEPNQQDALIAKWQGSNVYKALFGTAGENGAEPKGPGLAQAADDEDEATDDLIMERPTKRASTGAFTSVPGTAPNAAGFVAVNSGNSVGFNQPAAPSPLREATSLSDIVAKDAARSTFNESQILAPLGFAANETIDDFYNIGGNLEPIPNFNELEYDADMEKVFYELGMGGRQFPG